MREGAKLRLSLGPSWRWADNFTPDMVTMANGGSVESDALPPSPFGFAT